MRERIQKLLAARGIGSRRQVESWIAAGRITVNGKPATPGQPVGLRDDVRLDGRRLRLERAADAPHRGMAYHRPAQEGLRSRVADPAPGAIEKLPKAGGLRWVPVSPLPARDGGLELFVTDGALVAALTRRGYAISSEYSVRVRGEFDEGGIEDSLKSAAQSLAFKGSIESVTPAGGEGSNRWLQVVTTGFRPHDLRRALEAMGLEGNRILRTRYGPIAMDRALARGRSRPLTDGELKALHDAAQLKPGGSRQPGR
ncbi:MAG: rRNA pseudouridine synthase [Gammaproteobacteria bacterium]|nr:rRNA pseudouridine synthase [Gammaproteobacteria bacterium]